MSGGKVNRSERSCCYVITLGFWGKDNFFVVVSLNIFNLIRDLKLMIVSVKNGVSNSFI